MFSNTRQIFSSCHRVVILAVRHVFAQGVSSLVQGEHVDAQLVAETERRGPRESLWVALRLVHMEKWHTYWKNPGDAGKPTLINWQLPQGVSAGEIVWPLPERFELPADLVDFGYTEEIFLLTELSIPDDILCQLPYYWRRGCVAGM